MKASKKEEKVGIRSVGIACYVDKCLKNHKFGKIEIVAVACKILLENFGKIVTAER